MLTGKKYFHMAQTCNLSALPWGWVGVTWHCWLASIHLPEGRTTDRQQTGQIRCTWCVPIYAHEDWGTWGKTSNSYTL